MSGPVPSRHLRGDAVVADPLVRELLAKRLVAVVATLDPGGAPHAVPVWFAVDGGAIVLATGSRSRKVRNVERDPRATVTVHDSRPGFEVCGVAVTGRMETVRGAEAEPLVALVHRRYVTEAGLELPEAAAFLASDDVPLRLHPERALTWDERGSAAAAALRAAGAALPLEPTTRRA